MSDQIRESAEHLYEHFWMYPWLQGTGVSGNSILVYVESDTHKDLLDLGETWDGFPVQVEVTGRIKPADELQITKVGEIADMTDDDFDSLADELEGETE